MRAIVLSAGQGRRLLPLTATDPKCLLPVDGDQTVLGVQLRALAACGIRQATILVGFGAERVEAFLARTPIPGLAVETLYNPFFAISDNLVTCWLARPAMTGDFVLLNGDTLFEPGVLRRVLEGSAAPLALTVDHKTAYDDDDMKVTSDRSGRLLAIGKKLPPATVNAESIGLLAFRGSGVRVFREALEASIRRPDAMRVWYLSVVNDLAQRVPIATVSIQGLWWQEIDSPDDLARARAAHRGSGEEPAGRKRVASASASAEPV